MPRNITLYPGESLSINVVFNASRANVVYLMDVNGTHVFNQNNNGNRTGNVPIVNNGRNPVSFTLHGCYKEINDGNHNWLNSDELVREDLVNRQNRERHLTIGYDDKTGDFDYDDAIAKLLIANYNLSERHEDSLVQPANS